MTELNRRRSPIALVALGLISIIAGKLIPSSATAQQPGQVQFSGQEVRRVIADGKPRGPQTMVLQAQSGSIELPTILISESSEGKPMSGTVAIAEPVEGKDDQILLRLDNASLSGSSFTGRQLVLEVDFRNMRPLLGQGAIYLVRPGISKLRLGNLIVNTANAQDWSSVEMTESLSTPKITGIGIKVEPVSPQK
jgi:hypothetical protein